MIFGTAVFDRVFWKSAIIHQWKIILMPWKIRKSWEGLFYAEFDMEKLRCYREREMLGNTFRKVKAYAPLLDEKVEYPFVRE